jgi:hypothetical protein
MPIAYLNEFVGRVLVFVGGPVSPAQHEWDDHIRALEAHAAKHPDMRSLVWSGGANLPPAQRKQLTETMPKTARTAVLTKSPLDRGVVTALSWFLGGIKAFAPEDEAGAIAYLELDPEEARAALAVGRRLRRQMESETP